MGYSRLFDERSEQIVAQSRLQVAAARGEVEAVARQYVLGQESRWTLEQTVLTSRLASYEAAASMESSAIQVQFNAEMQVTLLGVCFRDGGAVQVERDV